MGKRMEEMKNSRKTEIEKRDYSQVPNCRGEEGVNSFSRNSAYTFRFINIPPNYELHAKFLFKHPPI